MSKALGGIGISEILNILLAPDFVHYKLFLTGSPLKIGTFSLMAIFWSITEVYPGTI